MITCAGTPKGRARPIHWKAGLDSGLQLAAGDELGDAAAGDEQDQRGDDRLHPEPRHQYAVEQPAQRRHQQRCDDGQQERLAVQHQRGADLARDRHHRADREVDPAGADHDRHADGDDRDRRGLPQQDEQQRLRCQEVRGLRSRCRRTAGRARRARRSAAPTATTAPGGHQPCGADGAPLVAGSATPWPTVVRGRGVSLPGSAGRESAARRSVMTAFRLGWVGYRVVGGGTRGHRLHERAPR